MPRGQRSNPRVLVECPNLETLYRKHKAIPTANMLGLGPSTVAKFVQSNEAPIAYELAAAQCLEDDERSDKTPASGHKILICKIRGNDYAMIKEMLTRLGAEIAFKD